MQVSLQTIQQLAEKKKVSNWVIRALFVTIVINFLMGIFGLAFAIISRFQLSRNNIKGAQKTSKIAGITTIISFWIGLAAMIAEGIFYMVTKQSFEDVLFFK